MQNNFSCQLCGRGIYRSLSQQKQSSSKLFFCTPWCKSVYASDKSLSMLPKNSIIFKIISQIYGVNRQPDYLTNLSFIKVHPNYVNQLGDYVVSAEARTNGNPTLTSKTPNDISTIKSACSIITLSDINSLLQVKEAKNEFNSDWKSIDFRYWNSEDISYSVLNY